MKQGTTVYLAGPMSRRQFFNFPAFDRARDALLAKGLRVISPADLDRELDGFDGLECSPDDPCDYTPTGMRLPDLVRRDVDGILRADAIVFIDDEWPESLGGRTEYQVAHWARKDAFLLMYEDTEAVLIPMDQSKIKVSITVEGGAYTTYDQKEASK